MIILKIKRSELVSNKMPPAELMFQRMVDSHMDPQKPFYQYEDPAGDYFEITQETKHSRLLYKKFNWSWKPQWQKNKELIFKKL
jgi:hypothetical protein